MSGHSKWSTIKHKKGAADAKRGKIFTKLGKAITVAARAGGGDSEINTTLRTAVLAARAANMPNDNIDRAIKRGTGELEGVSYEEVFYEGYGPSGVAIYVQCLTDNKNRTAAEMRSIFSKHNGNMAGMGSVAWLFEPKGLIVVDVDKANEETLMDLAIEAGAEDFSKSGDVYEIVTAPQDFEVVRLAIEKKSIPMKSADLTRIPKNQVAISSDDVSKILKLIDKIEDNDDVQNVYANFEIPDDMMNEDE
jgi:YebC/PmpR family DNA-binding regulatory protein